MTKHLKGYFNWFKTHFLLEKGAKCTKSNRTIRKLTLALKTSKTEDKQKQYHSLPLFEPRSISRSYGVIVRVRVVLKRTIVGILRLNRPVTFNWPMKKSVANNTEFFSELPSPGRSHKTNYRIQYHAFYKELHTPKGVFQTAWLKVAIKSPL